MSDRKDDLRQFEAERQRDNESTGMPDESPTSFQPVVFAKNKEMEMPEPTAPKKQKQKPTHAVKPQSEEAAQRSFGISSFALHIFAMAVMVIDHIGYYNIEGGLLMRMIGRLAFPIFAFMIAEGFRKTSSAGNYLLRITAFAVVTEFAFDLYFFQRIVYLNAQNVLWTFALAVLAMIVMKKAKRLNRYIFFAIAAVTTAAVYMAADYLYTDYGGGGVLTVLVFYFFSGTGALSMVSQMVGLLAINWLLLGSWQIGVELFGQQRGFPIQLLAVISLIPIWLYSGKQGYYNKVIKYAYYLFYPVHLLILYFVILM